MKNVFLSFAVQERLPRTLQDQAHKANLMWSYYSKRRL